MLFSVIVPVYKVEEYLERCINSVLKQSFKDFELILVDDGSPDKCPQICDEYAKRDCRVRVIHKENGGLVSARQAGIKIAKGDYVFNLDSDDAIADGVFESAYEIINSTNADIISFSYVCYEQGVLGETITDPLDEGLYDKTGIEKYIMPKLLVDNNMNHISYYLSGKAIKREVITKHQLNVSTQISLGEDLCCVVPCYLEAEKIYMSKILAYLYTKRKDSISKHFNTKQILQVEDVINALRNINLKKPDDFEEQIARYSCFMCFAILADAAQKNQFNYIKEIKNIISNSIHKTEIQKSDFKHITLKSRIGIFLMKKQKIALAFYFLYVCKEIKRIFKKG